jgi:hypothetical protein
MTTDEIADDGFYEQQRKMHNNSSYEEHTGTNKKAIELMVVPSKAMSLNSLKPAPLVARIYSSKSRLAKT